MNDQLDLFTLARTIDTADVRCGVTKSRGEGLYPDVCILPSGHSGHHCAQNTYAADRFGGGIWWPQ